ncbi:MAG: tetratricopeptide repeat protein [Byssovorax sp.]
MVPARRRRPRRRAIALAALLASHALPAGAIALSPARAAAQPAPPAPQPAPPDAYRQHMENGIKLYQDRNYDAAIVEFRAAYDLRQKASPLINLALAYKAEFKYPKAIDALKQALDRHADTMSADDQKAAESEIRDMEALLAFVQVKVVPREATLLVDGEEQPPGTADRPIRLGPGTHKIGARAEGYAEQEQPVTVASGEQAQPITLALAPDKGWVSLTAADPKITIAVDQQVLGTGKWAGLLPPGTHLVQMYGPGAPTYAAQILVVAGKQLILHQGMGQPALPPMPTATPVTAPPKKKEEPPHPPRRGVYLLASGSLLFPTRHPVGFPQPKVNSGAAGGLRAGYQVNSIAGFELGYQHASLYTPSGFEDNTGYTLSSDRFGGHLRLGSTGKTARFMSTIGGGFVSDRVSFDHPPSLCGAGCRKASGLDPFFLLEAGLELDFSGVLVDLMLETQSQSSREITPVGTTGGASIFDSEPLFHIGPSLRVGYGFW